MRSGQHCPYQTIVTINLLNKFLLILSVGYVDSVKYWDAIGNIVLLGWSVLPVPMPETGRERSIDCISYIRC